jgi:hypothetical protein
MEPLKRVSLAVTQENVWFLERYLNVFDFVELFPPDAIAPESGRGVPVVLKTDLGFAIESDIEHGKLQLRNRSKLRGWTRWTTEHALAVGDRIILEKTGEREYRLDLEKATTWGD